ncbi:translation initiation factor 2 [Actinoplanes awajinensis subsp. mycoplanecinus]|uniref:Translation initiation factor 2 n=1 Tax=Actinoplanes awajinensis subsp. mycoplanecinus TaxID=135947 RepID=A0A117MPX4_9ACTN|nr:translation initiation factor 2 [Actinoplanes awajinensis subsp. mycoplanecinus]
MNVSSPTSGPPGDAYWQRPGPDAASLSRPPQDQPATPEPPAYPGPPRTDPPSVHWRPPTIATPPEPRHMPGQNMDAIEEAEGSARTVTFGVGLVAGAVALILICLLCGRALF